jgi:ABC-type multidrug transport system permease subunit
MQNRKMKSQAFLKMMKIFSTKTNSLISFGWSNYCIFWKRIYFLIFQVINSYLIAFRATEIAIFTKG